MTAWLGVVSRAHVQRGVAGGFAQLCHGKAQPLQRMQRGDRLVYWGMALRRGHLPLAAADLALIARAMGVRDET
jgi:hypothetical protein